MREGRCGGGSSGRGRKGAGGGMPSETKPPWQPN